MRAEKWAYEHIKNILPVPEFFDAGSISKRSYSIAFFIEGVIPNPTISILQCWLVGFLGDYIP